MNRIKLDDKLSFFIEQEEKRLRLIVFNNNEELVCHKANPIDLKRFIESEEGHLFKGRLQLDKKDGSIFLSVKGDTIGAIDLPEFERLINQSYQPKQIT
ncbi:MAG TPA: hypothetical protein VIM89_23385 [Mucilaginibacter sp.]